MQNISEQSETINENSPMTKYGYSVILFYYVLVAQKLGLGEISLEILNPSRNKARRLNSLVYYDYFYLTSLEI